MTGEPLFLYKFFIYFHLNATSDTIGLQETCESSLCRYEYSSSSLHVYLKMSFLCFLFISITNIDIKHRLEK
jgi:hypothetical protein